MAPFSSPPRLPRGLKWRLSLVALNKTPSTAKQIETKLQFADLRRQLVDRTPELTQIVQSRTVRSLNLVRL
ncbi:unnamed protein product [Prunus armeniaca]|uniref:Uncharacterized protein n=1 Tax=Prunus armeniaca TaxID=36596 RepID=A0A6J5TUJ7_PRUAR|nr:unnamed protein product [Prunus armeniaca]